MAEQQQTKLDWDISNIKDKGKLLVVDEENSVEGEEPKYTLVPVTQELIFATTQVGLDEITRANFVAFWLRTRALDAWMGSPRVISLTDIEAHIGLKTNAEKLTQAKWFGSVKKLVADQYKTLKENAVKSGSNDEVEVIAAT